MSANDYRSDLDMWADMWDEMQQSDIHPEIEKPQPAPYAPSRTAQDTYYDYFDAEDGFQPEVDDQLLQEDRVPNPIHPSSLGHDNEQPKPVWVSEELFKEVESLKNRLFKLENQMARMGQAKTPDQKKVHSFNDKSMFSEIKALRSRIDKVSSRLGIKDEPPTWDIK